MATGSTSATMSIQTQQLVAQIISILGMVATSFGWLTSEQVASLSTNVLAVIGPLATIGGIIYSWLAARKSAVVSEVANLPEVKAVVTEPTREGLELSRSSATPNNVVVSGTPVP